MSSTTHHGLWKKSLSAAGAGLAALVLAATALGVQAHAEPQDDAGTAVSAEETDLGALATHDTLAAGRLLYIYNSSGKCLEIENSSTKNGAPAQQWTCNRQAGSKWYPHALGDGWYNFKNASGKCLEITNSSTGNGANAQQWTCNQQDGARWRVERAADGHIVIRNHSGKVLEITNSSTGNGANAQQWSYNGQSGAWWH
ncbi:RICIN domain-containing protein [Kitasatospora sp. CM 4170]|uniref:RICIN domain-containing protein n=1 Tax=Kitasatospora aburaviensis TaxID=67265 RepID=A0ABW1EYY6_9ACTN|nr:RICIN domain-containing protein [Kitasatospora sp. CM 4170]WNM49653.1 RICIN domain-containing protein [Kitasatospora sp. CM 4170]